MSKSGHWLLREKMRAFGIVEKMIRKGQKGEKYR